MPDEPLATLRAIALELGLPESTVRYYRDAFAPYLPAVGAGRRRRYPPVAVAALRLIALRYQEGKSREDIEGELAALHAPEIHARRARSEVRGGAGHASDAPGQALGADELLATILDGERERRQAMWQMAREMLRLGEALERQRVVLGDIAQRLAALTERRVPAEWAPHPAAAMAPRAGPSGAEATRVAAHGATPATAARTAGTGGSAAELLHELDGLRRELADEKALVERLRQSKLTIERRLAEAEARAERARESEAGQPGAARSRLLSRDG